MGLSGAVGISRTGSTALGSGQASFNECTAPQQNDHAVMRAEARETVLIGHVTRPVEDTLDGNRVTT